METVVMKIAFVTTAFTPQMSGYAGMALPKAMAALGDTEVHVISPNLNVYHSIPDYSLIYERFLGPAETLCGTQLLNGFTLHRLPHWKVKDQVYIRGLGRVLHALKPDVVQAWIPNGPVSMQLAMLKPFLGFRFFTGQHTTKSVFPLANQAQISLNDWARVFCTRIIPGRLISLVSDGCYAATSDCGEIAVRFMGVQKRKCFIRNLGVDVELFHPVTTTDDLSERERMRRELGFLKSEIVCIYTGRLAVDKNPLCLAQAIKLLRESGQSFTGLFIGDGPQKTEIEACLGSCCLPFRAYSELPSYYRLSDIGVWPTQESTSMLDAAASGLPIVVSDKLVACERIDGNGLSYRQNDPADMARALATIATGVERKKLGMIGRQRMVESFSWNAIARRTLNDFRLYLSQMEIV
jgi:glycosyltransferase involved in cell wall biosynthesis